MGRLFSPRVLVMAAALVLLVGWIELFEPEPVRPTVLLPTLAKPVTEVEVVSGAQRAVYAPAKDRFVLVGPPEAVADEAKRGEASDGRAAREPTFTGLVGDRVPSVWRGQRLSALMVASIVALRDRAVVLMPEPGAADRARFGTDQPHVTVRLRAGETIEIKIGAAAPGSSARYFQCPARSAWGLIAGDVVARLERLASRALPEE